MNAISLIDAGQQGALAFLVPQLSYIETEVYKIQYPEVLYPKIVPVDTSANPWAPSVTYYSFDQLGQAAWFNGRAQDVPNANVTRAKFETPIKMGAIGYEWTLEELNQARLLGRNLAVDKGDAARFAAEKFIDNVALLGDVAAGFYGLLNNPTVTAGLAAANGNNGATAWSTKTPDNVNADVNNLLTGIWSSSNTVELADTLLVPPSRFGYLNSTRIGTDGTKTILSFIRENNVYSQQTGGTLLIQPVRQLETIGAGGTPRAVAYKRDPRVVKMHLPMPFQFENVPYPVAPMTWHIPGIFRVGGVDIRRPAAFRYQDGI